MSVFGARLHVAVLLVSVTIALGAMASPASAFNPIKPVCAAAGFFNGLIGKACSAVQHGDRLLAAGKNLLTGHVGGAVKSLAGDGTNAIASKATTALALAAIATWVAGGASYVLHETSTVLSRTTDPQLTTTWFSATYWRVAGIAAVLTLPFLFAVAVQATLQSDLTLLARAALGYLPLALLAVGIAAPLTMLLLAASDQLSAVVSSAAGHQSANFLNHDSGLIGALTHVGSSAFLGFFAGLLTVSLALALWLELMVRAAAVYVIVLMLPLTFAAFVWPARRIWAIRSVELLIALILSKFVIVAVLSLGGAAFSQSVHYNLAGMLAGVALLALGGFAPWALLRLLPMTELASAAAGSLRHEGSGAFSAAGNADAQAHEGELWAAKAAHMRREAQQTENVDPTGAVRERLRPVESPPVDTEDAPAASVEPAAGATVAGAPTPAAGAPTPAAATPASAAAMATPPRTEAGAAEPSAGGGGVAEPPQTNAEPAFAENPELPELLRSGAESGPMILGPEHPDLTPPPQDPEGGRL